MIWSWVHSAGAVLAGLVVASVLIVAVEVFSSIVHPFPPDVDPSDYAVCKAHVARCPAWVLAAAVLAWGLTTFLSAWLATRLGSGRHFAHGIVVGLILVALVVLNMSMLPYPIWFWVPTWLFFPWASPWGPNWEDRGHRGGSLLTHPASSLAPARGPFRAMTSCVQPAGAARSGHEPGAQGLQVEVRTGLRRPFEAGTGRGPLRLRALTSPSDL